VVDGRTPRRSGGADRRAGRSTRGAALVEFALVAPVLFCLLLGIVTGGVALSRKNSITNAVREGTRVGATIPISPSWAADVRDRVTSLAGGDLTTAQVCVELRRVTSSGSTQVQAAPSSCSLSSSPPSVPASAPVNSCVVRVWAQRTSDVDAFFFSRNVTLTARAIGQYERSC
jgi:Flp pilus assembly protein TadG